MLIKGFLRLRSVNPGFNPANVITMYLQLTATRYPQIPSQTNFRRELLGWRRGEPAPGLPNLKRSAGPPEPFGSTGDCCYGIVKEK